MNKVNAWFKKQFEMTPKRRLDASYWLATFQAIVMMSFFHDLETASVEAWAGLIVIWLLIGYLYVKNTIAFQKETLWMTIKNPEKVTREEGTDRFGQPQVRPKSPPPPGTHQGNAARKKLNVPRPPKVK